MAGMNAFPALRDLRRIRREEIEPTLRFVAEQVRGYGITLDILRDGLMGSAGKQDDSGDLDIVLDAAAFPRGILWDLTAAVTHVHPEVYIETRQLPGDLLITAWPVVASWSPDGTVVFGEGRVQIDLFWGHAEWMKFTHWSPGRDRSPYPGVMINAALHQYGHLHPIYSLSDRHGPVAVIEWYLDLLQGIQPTWKLRKQPGQDPGVVDPDTWETQCPAGDVFRMTRTGLIRDPDVAVRLLFGDGVTRADIATFEGLWAVIERLHSTANDHLGPAHCGRGASPAVIKAHLITYLVSRTPLKKLYTAAEMAALPVWAHVD